MIHVLNVFFLFDQFQVQKLFTSAHFWWTYAIHLWATHRLKIFHAIWWKGTKAHTTITIIKTKWMELIIHHNTTTSLASLSSRRRKIRATAGVKLDGHLTRKSISLTWISSFVFCRPLVGEKRSAKNIESFFSCYFII